MSPPVTSIRRPPRWLRKFCSGSMKMAKRSSLSLTTKIWQQNVTDVSGSKTDRLSKTREVTNAPVGYFHYRTSQHASYQATYLSDRHSGCSRCLHVDHDFGHRRGHQPVH